MINLKKEYQNMFKQLDVEKKQEEIYKNIVNGTEKKEKGYLKSNIVMACTVLLLILGGLGIAYAKELEKIFGHLTKTVETEGHIEFTSNSFLEMNYDADLPEAEPTSVPEMKATHKKYDSFKELGNALGVQILQSDQFTNQTIYQDITKKVDGKIAFASFYTENLTNAQSFEEGNIYVDISFMTKYYPTPKDNDIKITSASKRVEYYIKNLNTTAYIFKPSHEQDRTQQWCVILEYENIRYNFTILFVHKDPEVMQTELITLLESLKY